MNKLPEGTNGAPPMAVQPIALPEGFLPSWAGALRRGVFGFASEDGKWLITNEQGKNLSVPGKASVSGEAVNGTAISDIWIAMSTRADVALMQVQPESKRSTGCLYFSARGAWNHFDGKRLLPCSAGTNCDAKHP